MQYDVFLSYCRRDASIAERLLDALREDGLSVWWDQDITPGALYLHAIERHVSSARAVVVLWSESSVERDWVLAEANVARQRGTLLPVHIDDVMPPAVFTMLQSVSLVGWSGDRADMRYQRLLAAIRGQERVHATERSHAQEPEVPREIIAPQPRGPHGGMWRGFVSPQHWKQWFGCVLLLTIGVLCIRSLERAGNGAVSRVQSAARRLVQEHVRRESRSLERVAIVDVDAVNALQPGENENASDGRPITPREPLLQLIRECAEAGAAAIVVDVDMSMSSGFWLSVDDPGFLSEIQRIGNVYVGVHRARFGAPEGWLGKGFESVGAAMTIPKQEWPHALHSLHVRDARSSSVEDTLFSFAARVARALGTERRRHVPTAVEWLVTDRVVEVDGGTVTRIYYPTSYDGWSELRDRRIKLSRVERPSIQEGQVVFIGAFDGSDEIPTLDGIGGFAELPGSVLHALAYVGLTEQALLLLAPAGRVAAVLLLVLVTAAVERLMALRLWRSGLRDRQYRLTSLRLILSVAVATAVMLAVATQTRILWHDYWWASPLLALCIVAIHLSAARTPLRAQSEPHSLQRQ